MLTQEALAAKAMVVTGHALATEAALDVLKRGGNAVDASVCAALVLCVVCPYACTLAGDAYLLIHDPQARQVIGLNGTGAAPKCATLDRFANGIPKSGPAAATVPGLVAAMADALDRFGSMTFGDLLAPAIVLAEEGFAVHPYFAHNIENRKKLLAEDERAAALFLPDGVPLASQAVFRQPDLAQTLRRLARHGPREFYHGALSQALAAASAAQGGLLTAQDMAAHASLWQEPVHAIFYGHEVWTMPPNSFGPTLLLQLIQLEAEGVGKMNPDSAAFIGSGFAARQKAYKAAARLIGDPELCELPLRRLLKQAAHMVLEPKGGMPPESRDRCTTNAVIVDKDGLAVSLIESISTPFGAGVMLGDTGIVLNNRLGGFSTDPESLNVLAPGKRPAHTLAPCLVTRGGEFIMTIGTPGTVGQTCTLAQVLARILACGQPPFQAVAAARWSVDFQGKLILEDMLDDAVRDEVLASHTEARTERTGWISFGSIKLAMREGGGYRGVADARRSAFAAGY